MTAETRTFQELIDRGVLEIGDGYRAQNSELSVRGRGPIFLRAGHVTDTHINFGGVERFRDPGLPGLTSKMSRVGDVVVTTKGNSTGRVAFVTAAMPPFVYSPHLSFWRSLDQDTLAPDFLRYWSRSAEFLAQLAGMSESTDMAPYLSLKDQRSLTITIPEPDRQRAIASVLKIIDDKIDLNRSMDQTLDAMAAALFRSWFVDFDPVVAKSEGRRPFGMVTETSDLFPSGFVESQLGPVPTGWTVKQWGDLATLEYGKGLREYSSAGCFRVYGTNGPIGWHGEALCHGEGVIIGRKGAYRGVHYSPAPFFVIDTAFFLRRRPGLHFSVKWAYRELLRIDLDGMDSGSAIPSTSRDDVYQQSVLLPPAPVLQVFEEQVSPLQAMQDACSREIYALEELRDALLPGLLSGDVRLRDAEKALKQVV